MDNIQNDHEIDNKNIFRNDNSFHSKFGLLLNAHKFCKYLTNIIQIKHYKWNDIIINFTKHGSITLNEVALNPNFWKSDTFTLKTGTINCIKIEKIVETNKFSIKAKGIECWVCSKDLNKSSDDSINNTHTLENDQLFNKNLAEKLSIDNEILDRIIFEDIKINCEVDSQSHIQFSAKELIFLFSCDIPNSNFDKSKVDNSNELLLLKNVLINMKDFCIKLIRKKLPKEKIIIFPFDFNLKLEIFNETLCHDNKKFKMNISHQRYNQILLTLNFISKLKIIFTNELDYDIVILINKVLHTILNGTNIFMDIFPEEKLSNSQILLEFDITFQEIELLVILSGSNSYDNNNLCEPMKNSSISWQEDQLNCPNIIRFSFKTNILNTLFEKVLYEDKNKWEPRYFSLELEQPIITYMERYDDQYFIESYIFAPYISKPQMYKLPNLLSEIMNNNIDDYNDGIKKEGNANNDLNDYDILYILLANNIKEVDDDNDDMDLTNVTKKSKRIKLQFKMNDNKEKTKNITYEFTISNMSLLYTTKMINVIAQNAIDFIPTLCEMISLWIINNNDNSKSKIEYHSNVATFQFCNFHMYIPINSSTFPLNNTHVLGIKFDSSIFYYHLNHDPSKDPISLSNISVDIGSNIETQATASILDTNNSNSSLKINNNNIKFHKEKITLTLDQFELFLCKINHIINNEIDLNKSSILLPFSITITKQIIIQLGSNNELLSTNIIYHADIQRLFIQVSILEIFIIYETILHELAYIHQDIIHKLILKWLLWNKGLSKATNNNDNNLSKNEIIEFKAKSFGAKIVILNDDNNNWVYPIFQLIIKPSEIKFNLLDNKLILILDIVTYILYFNDRIQKWEPFLEKSSFSVYLEKDLETGLNHQNNILSTTLHITSAKRTSTLELNLSDDCLKIIIDLYFRYKSKFSISTKPTYYKLSINQELSSGINSAKTTQIAANTMLIGAKTTQIGTNSMNHRNMRHYSSVSLLETRFNNTKNDLYVCPNIKNDMSIQNNDVIIPYKGLIMIENYSGYSIYFKLKKHRYIIKANHIKSFNTGNDIPLFIKKVENSTRKAHIEIMFNSGYEQDIYPISEQKNKIISIDIDDEMNESPYKLGTIHGHDDINKANITSKDSKLDYLMTLNDIIDNDFIVCNIKDIHIGRIITISSKYTIANHLDNDIWIRLKVVSNIPLILHIPAHSKVGIPVNYISSAISFKFNSKDTEWCNEFLLNRYFYSGMNNNTYITSLPLDRRYALLVKRSPKIPGQFELIIQYELEIQNCLLFPIDIQIFMSIFNFSVNSPYTFIEQKILQPFESYKLTSGKYVYPTCFKFKYSTLDWSDMINTETLIRNKEVLLEHNIISRISNESDESSSFMSYIDKTQPNNDYEGHETNNINIKSIKTLKKNYNSCKKRIMLGCKHYITDQTPWNVMVCTEKKEIHKTNGTICNFSPMLPDEKIQFMCYGLKNQKTGLKPKLLTNWLIIDKPGKMEVTLKEIGVKNQVQGVQYDCIVNTTSHEINGFNYIISILKPQYIIKNNTKYSLIIKQSQNTQYYPEKIILPDEIGALEFFDSTFDKSYCIKINNLDQNKDIWLFSNHILANQYPNEFEIVLRTQNYASKVCLKCEVTMFYGQIYAQYQELRQNLSDFTHHDYSMDDSLIYTNPFIEEISLKDTFMKIKYVYTGFRHKIDNQLDDIDISICQACAHERCKWDIPSKQCIDYAWDDPNQEHKVFINFITKNNLPKIKSISYIFEANNDLPFEIKITKNDKNHKEKKILIKVFLENGMKILRFYYFAQENNQPSVHVQNQNQKKSILNNEDQPKRKYTISRRLSKSKYANYNDSINKELMLNITIENVGISLIGYLNNKRYELLYLTLKGYELDVINNTNDPFLEFKMKLDMINIDNNSKIQVNFPVLLTSRNQAELPKNSFSILGSIDKRSIIKNREFNASTMLNYIKLNAIKIILNPIMIKIDNNMVNLLTTFYENICNIMLYKYYYWYKMKGLIQLQYANNIPQDNNKTFLLKKKNVNDVLNNIKDYEEHRFNYYIEQAYDIIYSLINPNYILKELSHIISVNLLVDTIAISPFLISYSYYYPIILNNREDNNSSTCSNSNSSIKDILSINNTMNDILSCKSIIEIKDYLYNIDITLSIIKQYFFKEINPKFKKHYLNIIVHNPKTQWESIGNSITDTVSTTFEKINKITGTVGRGLTVITGDNELIHQRETQQLKRPKNVIDGIGQAAKSFAKGVQNGISGVFVKPIEGASKSGVKGFFKGAFKGVTGLLVNPLAGIADATAKTAEGLKYSAMTDIKPNENRIRNPRIFFNKNKYFNEFEEDQSNLALILSLIDKNIENLTFRGIYLVENRLLADEEDENIQKLYLIITEECIFTYEVENGTLGWKQDMSKLHNAIFDGNKIELIFADEQQEKSDKINENPNNTTYTKGQTKKTNVKNEQRYVIYSLEINDIHRLLIDLINV